ncbi:MAG: methionine gamma-lyase family protein [Bacillota bacterium]
MNVGRLSAPDILRESYGIDPALVALAGEVLAALPPQPRTFDSVVSGNLARVLAAARRSGVHESDLRDSTGYGYGDRARDLVEALYAAAFQAERALVRQQIVSGTHALALALFGCLRPGDELLAATGTPYDTLLPVISAAPGSLAEFGVAYREVPLAGGSPDPAAVAAAVRPATRVVLIQRSRGYDWRDSVPVETVGRLVAAVKEVHPEVICLVDNCYGEFVEDREPTAVGADVIAGSLIKNPGGGLATTGGYVAGRAHLVELAASRLTAPGIGAKVGATTGFSRLAAQGLFLAPGVVARSLEGMRFAAAFFSRLGFAVSPGPEEPRTDIIQAIRLGSEEAMVAFCRGLQKASPVDADVRPEPAATPGYSDRVVMAGGTFVQGSSIELSADGPLRPPFAVYLQGGLDPEHVLFACVVAAQELTNIGALNLKRLWK